MFSVDYYIGRFSQIPKELWAVGDWETGNGRKCAMGHMGDTGLSCDEPKEFRNPEAVALEEMFEKYLKVSVIAVNDNNDIEVLEHFPQEHPKDRILAALEKIKGLQKKEEEVSRVKTVYVTVPESITEEAKQFVEEAILS